MPSNRLRTAIYVPHCAVPDCRGCAPAIVAWNFALHTKGADALFISAQENYRQRIETINGIPIHRLQEGRLYRRLFRKITRLDPYPLYRRAAAILRHEPWDLLHVHQLEFPVRDFFRYVPTRRPVLLHAHVTTNPFDPDRGVADRYIAASHYIRERLIESKGYPSERIVVVQNGVDQQMFAPADANERRHLRREFGLPESGAVLAFFGRKLEVKGFHTWLSVASTLLQRHKDLWVVAMGPEPKEAVRDRSYDERQQLRRQLLETGRFSDLPMCPHPQLADFLRAVDIALLPSLAEPQGMAMIEAMASGCVTISSNVGGIRESIRHGETGYLLQRPDDAEEAIALCESMLQRTQEWPALCSRARADIVARFAWAVVGTQLEQVYRDVLRGAVGSST